MPRKYLVDIIDALYEHADTLERFPERCPLIRENELRGTSYRHLLYKKYRIIFRVQGKVVYCNSSSD